MEIPNKSIRYRRRGTPVLPEALRCDRIALRAARRAENVAESLRIIQSSTDWATEGDTLTSLQTFRNH